MEERRSILIVDDDDDVRCGLTRVFRTKGCDAEAVGTGKEAIRCLEARVFDAAIVDIKLPDMDGTDVVASLKKSCPDLVVIMATAFASLETAVSALIQGASAYLMKPLDVDEVYLTVSEAIQKQRLTVENQRLYEEAQSELVERRQAEEIIRGERDNLMRILEAMGDGVCIVAPGCRIEYANPSLVAEFGPLAGDSCLEYLGVGDSVCPWCRRLPGNDHGVIRWEWHSPARDRTYDLVATPLQNSDGTESELMIFRDITERKQAEELFRTVSLRSPAGMYIAQDGCFAFANPQFLRDVGFAEDDLLGASTLSIVHPDDRESVRQNAVEMLRGDRVSPYEYRTVGGDGETRWLLETVASIQYRGQRAALGNVLDITAHKQLEKKMVEYEELDGLKTNLLSTVSHELRTPLAIIKGYSTMLLDYQARLQEEEKQQHLGAIDRATDRLTELVDHLLDMSRLDAGLLKMEKEPADVSRLIEEAVAEAQIAASPGRVVSHFSEGPFQAIVDARRVRQVLDNLIDNAIKYSGDAGGILVEIERLHAELHISVADQGIGIPEEDIERVFDRMYRAEQRLTQGSNGLGLGLSVCKGMVEAHGGRIWVDSLIGVGTTFHFTLPLAL